LPSLFWLIIYLREDKKEPEPHRLLFSLFIWGMVAAAGALVLELITQEFIEIKIPFYKLFFFTFAAPLIEELLKFILIKKICFGQRCFSQIIDGVIYAVSLSLGFAMFENFFYFTSFLSLGTSALLGGIALRTFTSTLLHTLSTGWMGYWMGKSRFDGKNETRFLITGFSIAFLIHSAFNLFLLTNSFIYLLFTLIVAFDLLFIKLRMHEAQIIQKWISPQAILKIFKK